MQSYIFIGGGNDSLNFPVADDIESIQLPVGVTDRETYIRDTISVGDASITVYRHESLTPEEVLNQLVGHYKRSPVRWPPRRTSFSGRLSTG